ncbi:MAG: DUF4386 domain-containing protein [Candidatus Nanopelagicales bacterium]
MSRRARLAGGLYLTYILLTTLATTTRGGIIVEGDPAATARNIAASEELLRVSFVLDVLAGVLFLLTAWALYVLLKPVNRDLALLFLLLNLAGVAVQCLNLLNLFAAVVVLGDPGFLATVGVDPSQSLATLFLDLYDNGFVIAQFFFAAWLLPLGYLVYRSGYLPRFLGVLLMVEFVAWGAYPLQYFLLPDWVGLSYVSFVVGLIAELTLALWLLVRGATEPEPVPEPA